LETEKLQLSLLEKSYWLTGAVAWTGLNFDVNYPRPPDILCMEQAGHDWPERCQVKRRQHAPTLAFWHDVVDRSWAGTD
jgi:hypothetical protein